MPGYQEGFADACLVFLRAALEFKDLSKLVTYIELASERFEPQRVDWIIKQLDMLTIKDYEGIHWANEKSGELETP